MSCSGVCTHQLETFESVTVICAQVPLLLPPQNHLSISHSRKVCLTVAPRVGHWESLFLISTNHSEMPLP